MPDIIAIDAGATWIKATRYTDALQPNAHSQVASGAATGPDEYFASIAAAFSQCGGGTNTTVGLALPALLSPDRTSIRYMANVKNLGVGHAPVSIQEVLKNRLGTTRIVADNDAACAALGEWAQGHGQSDYNARLLHLTWGTGIGTGFVTNGSAHYGWEGGHMPLTWSSPAPTTCGCGSTIDLEAHAAVPKLLEQLSQRLQAGQRSRLTPADFADPRETSRRVIAYASAGDALCQEVLRETLGYVAQGLLAMSVIAYPTVVTIGGAMMSSDWLLATLHTCINTHATGIAKDTLRPDIVRRAALGNEAGMLGAAVLAQQNFFKKIPGSKGKRG